MKKEYKVYKIENIMNNKVYIGYTSLSISERLHKHYTNALYGTKSKLYDSIRKNGISCFKLSQLFLSNSKEDTVKMEIFFIEKYDSFKSGYNMTLGGDGGDCTLYMSSEQLKDYKQKLSLCNSGYNNNTFSGYSDDEIVDFGVKCYLDNNNWIQSHWMKNYCSEFNIPKSYSKFRFNGEGFRGFKKRVLDKLVEMGYNIKDLKYKKTDDHKNKLASLYKGKKWYHNDELKINKQIYIEEVDHSWLPGRKKYN
jgi:hypothetical protein